MTPIVEFPNLDCGFAMHIDDDSASDQRPRCRRFSNRSLALLGLWVVTLPLLWLLSAAWNSAPRSGSVALEVWIAGGLLLLIGSRLRLKWLRAGIGPRRLACLIALVPLVFLAQMRPELNLYPLLSWGMFSTPLEESSYFDYRVRLADGRVADMPFQEVLPWQSVGGFRASLDAMAATVWDETQSGGRRGEEAGDASELFASALHDLVDLLERNDVGSVEVRLCVVDTAADPPARCQVVIDTASAALGPDRGP